MENHVILVLHITDRLKEAVEVQRVLTEFGGNIKTRLGLHEVENIDAPNGLLILEIHGGEEKADALSGKINDIEGVEAKKIVFSH